MEKLRLGVVGTNFISDWFCEAVQMRGAAVCQAVYSRSEKTGRAFADRWGIPLVYNDFSSFLDSGIEAVYLASPNAFHYEQALAAIERGLSVLCEKPFVPDLPSFCRLREAAEKKGVVLMEAMRPAHDPALAQVRATLPRLGKIRRATFEYCQYSSRYDRFKAGELPNAFNPSLGNAALLDIGIYPLFWCVALFGRPKEVKASSVFLANGIEGEGSALLSYPEHQVSVVYSKITDSVTPMVICGEEGSLTIDRPQKPERLVFYPRGGDREELPYIPAANNMIYELDDFVRLVREGGKNPYLSYTEDALFVADAIRREAGIVFSLC